ncbi:abc transporter substrate-binding protein, partial [Lasius niger]
SNYFLVVLEAAFYTASAEYSLGDLKQKEIKFSGEYLRIGETTLYLRRNSDCVIIDRVATSPSSGHLDEVVNKGLHHPSGGHLDDRYIGTKDCVILSGVADSLFVVGETNWRPYIIKPEAAPLSPVPGPSEEGRDDGSSTGEPVRYKSVTRLVECGPEGKRVAKRILVPLDCPVDLEEA